MIDIQEISIVDWELYKNIRLRSLKESPDAFGSTFDAESVFTDSQWQERLAVSDRTRHALPLIAELDGRSIGIAFGVVHSSGDAYGKVYQMWVDPGQRGRGAGRLLLHRLIEWGKNKNIRGLELAVTTSNQAAVCLYQSMGFVGFGELEPLRPGSELQTQNMRLKFPVSDDKS